MISLDFLEEMSANVREVNTSVVELCSSRSGESEDSVSLLKENEPCSFVGGENSHTAGG